MLEKNLKPRQFLLIRLRGSLKRRVAKNRKTTGVLNRAYLILIIICLTLNCMAKTVIRDKSLSKPGMGDASASRVSGTDRFIISITIKNDSPIKKEYVLIEKGLVFTTEDAEDYDYQALVVCDIESISDDNAIESQTSTTWRVCIKPGSQLKITFTAYCLNDGFKPPPNNKKLVPAGFVIRKEKLEKVCRSQDGMHGEVDDRANLIAENIHVRGFSDDEDEDSACKKAIIDCIRKVLKELTIEVEPKSIANNSNLDELLKPNCYLDYEGSIEIDVLGEGQPNIKLINLNIFKRNVGEEGTSVEFRCDVVPLPNFVKEFGELLGKVAQKKTVL